MDKKWHRRIESTPYFGSANVISERWIDLYLYQIHKEELEAIQKVYDTHLEMYDNASINYSHTFEYEKDTFNIERELVRVAIRIGRCDLYEISERLDKLEAQVNKVLSHELV